MHFSEGKRQDIDLSADFQTAKEENTPVVEDINNKPELDRVPDFVNSSELNVNSTPLTDRQTAILFKVREIPLCRLRNLMEAFPDISERTIRNEIAVLIQNGLIKRVGLGGPNSYFESMELAPLPS